MVGWYGGVVPLMCERVPSTTTEETADAVSDVRRTRYEDAVVATGVWCAGPVCVGRCVLCHVSPPCLMRLVCPGVSYVSRACAVVTMI